MEAVAAGVVEVRSTEEWIQAADSTGEKMTVVFWGGPWCRKCQALKPKFVKLAGRFNKEGGDQQFIYADAKRVGAKDLEPGKISTVPTFQVWKDGKVLNQFVPGLNVNNVIPAVEAMIAECELELETEA